METSQRDQNTNQKSRFWQNQPLKEVTGLIIIFVNLVALAAWYSRNSISLQAVADSLVFSRSGEGQYLVTSAAVTTPTEAILAAITAVIIGAGAVFGTCLYLSAAPVQKIVKIVIANVILAISISVAAGLAITTANGSTDLVKEFAAERIAQQSGLKEYESYSTNGQHHLFIVDTSSLSDRAGVPAKYNVTVEHVKGQDLTETIFTHEPTPVVEIRP